MQLHNPTTDLLQRASAFLTRYVILPDDESAVALVLFVAHTWAFEAAHATPYLTVMSPDKQSGKTRLLEVLDLLVAHPWLVSNISSAVLYRRVDSERPTLLLDEVDAIFTRDGAVNEALRGVLNAGNRPSAKVSRCTGDSYAPQDFSVFCPKILSGIDNGRLPDTIRDRSVPIKMQRKRPEDEVARFRRRDVEPEAEALREKLKKWSEEYLHSLGTARPALPDELSDRMADAWEPLFAIADLAGEEWGSKARHAAVTLYATREPEDENPTVRVLGAIREYMGDREQVPSAELVRIINEDETLPFGDYNGGRGITARQLADHLRPFGISPGTIRQGANANQKGYRREKFEDAWARYLPGHPSDVPARRHTPLSARDLGLPVDSDMNTKTYTAVALDAHGASRPHRATEPTDDDLDPWQREVLGRHLSDEGERLTPAPSTEGKDS
jgi:hypothetical protein